MAAALNEHCSGMADEIWRLEAFRARLIERLKGLDFIVNGAEKHIPGSLSISFHGVTGEVLLHRLDLMGISIATGSACNSKETVVSHVNGAIGVPKEYALGTIQITLGIDNDEAQIDRIADSLKKNISKTVCN